MVTPSPNPRLQRTPSAPLSRKPFGAVKRSRVAIALGASLLLGAALQAKVPRVNGIRSVDFRNHTYCLSRRGRDHADTVTLVDGRHRFADDPEVAPGLSLLSVQYGHLQAGTPEEAVVVLRYENAGSALHYDYLFVFALGPEGLLLRHAGEYEAAAAIRFRDRSILVRAPFWLSTDAHCCPTYDATYTIQDSKGMVKVVALSLKRRSLG